MAIIPSNAGKKRDQKLHLDTAELIREKLTNALFPFFKGKTAKQRLNKAVDKAVESISGLVTTKQNSRQKLGGTVMTQSASMKNPATGEFNQPPRNV